MATIISAQDAFAHLTDVVSRAMRGEEIDIEQDGLVKLKLVPISNAVPPTTRVPGSMTGQFSATPDAFDALTDRELAEWGLA